MIKVGTLSLQRRANQSLITYYTVSWSKKSTVSPLWTFAQVNVGPSPNLQTLDYYLRFDFELLKPLNVIIFYQIKKVKH